jgi:integrase
MSTLMQTTIGGFNLQFYVERKRYTIYLSKKHTKQFAQSMKDIVDQLLLSRINMSYPPQRVIKWIEVAPSTIKTKLERAGLIEVVKPITIEQMIQQFISIKTPDIKPRTLEKYNINAIRFWAYFGQKNDIKLSPELVQKFQLWLQPKFTSPVVNRTINYIQNVLKGAKLERNNENTTRFWAFIGKETLVTNVTSDEIHNWKKWLLNKYATETVQSTITSIRSAFDYVVKKKIVPENPLDNIRCIIKVNRSKDRVITPDEYVKLLDACPNNQWRVIIALSRIGGVRGPCEIRDLHWNDINFQHNVITIREPKTEHHTGQGERLMPLFQDLRVELERLYADPEYKSKDYVITFFNRNLNQISLTHYTNSISQRAGLGKIERFFDNMRTTRSNELVRMYGSDLENAWLGHSDKTRKKYYWQPTDTELLQAANDTILQCKKS